MARLITLLPCEKVIVGRDNIPSLIALFEDLNLSISEGQDIDAVPKEAITFLRWAVFCEWEIDEKDASLKSADQVLEMEYPDGAIAPIRGKIPFVWNVAGLVRNHQDIYGFPVGQEGPYTIRVWLEKDGERMSEVGSRKLKVIHKIPPGSKTFPVHGQAPR